MGNRVHKSFYTRSQTHINHFRSTFLNELICVKVSYKYHCSHHTRENDFTKLTAVFHNSVYAADFPDLNDLKERNHMDNLGVDRGMILKQFLKKHSGRVVGWMHAAQVRYQWWVPVVTFQGRLMYGEIDC